MRSKTGKNGFHEDISRLQARLVIESEARGFFVISLFGLTSGAGVTTVATSTAVGLAQQSLPIALVDADTLRPAIHRIFQVAPAPGMAEALASGKTRKDGPRRTDIVNLSIVPSGNWSDAPPSLLPERWKHVLEPLREAYRMVIVDAGSANSVHADSLARASDAVVLVLECGRSPWEQVAGFAARMDEIGVPVLGVVLNKRRHAPHQHAAR